MSNKITFIYESTFSENKTTKEIYFETWTDALSEFLLLLKGEGYHISDKALIEEVDELVGMGSIDKVDNES